MFPSLHQHLQRLPEIIQKDPIRRRKRIKVQLVDSVLQGRFDDKNVFGAACGEDSEVGDFAVFDVGSDGGLIWGVEFEVGGPIGGPGGEERDAFAVALHEHELEGHHSRAAVVHVGYPIAVF